MKGLLAAPDDILFTDDFESGLGQWTVNAGAGDASIGNETFNSGSSSLRTRWGAVSINTNTIAANVPLAELSVWIRRGADSFSENPESGEDLVVEYRNTANNWVVLESFSGGGAAGQIYTRTYQLTGNALHNNLQIRFRQTGGSGGAPENGGIGWDYWHIDDVVVTERDPNFIPGLIGEWRFEEIVWNGSNNEVQDVSGNNLHLTAFSAATSNVNPAIVGDPGTCYYGVFNGSISFIQRDDDTSTADSLLDIPNTLTVTTWINTNVIPTSGLKSILSKDENYEFHINTAGEIFWWWSTATLTTSGANLQIGQWHHIAVTWQSGEQIIYVDGVERARSARTGSLILNNDPLQIGQDLDIASRFFDGYIDEVRIYENVLTSAQVNQVMNETHPCVSGGVCTLSYIDKFDLNSYSNSDGLDPWSGDWVETNDDNSATNTAGRIYINASELNMTNSVGSNTVPTIEREANLAGAVSAVLKVDLRTSNTLENGDRFEVSASSDGGVNWTALPGGTFSNDINNTYTFDLLGFASVNTRVRFRIIQGYRSGNEIMNLNNLSIFATKNCGPDHFRIVHDGNGINCLPEAITIRAEDSSNSLVTDYSGTVDLSLSTNHGNWQVLDQNGSSTDLAQGTLTDVANDNNGTATYQYNTADNGSVVLYLQNTVAEVANIAVAEGSIVDENSEGDITFRPFGFLFSPSPVPTQVSGKPFDLILTAAGQTPSQPQCGVIEEYTGNRSLNLWSTYSQPNTSPTPVNVNGTNIATSEALSSAQNVNFVNGVTTLNVRYDDAGIIRLAAKDEIDIGEPPDGNLDEIIGGVNSFVVRPFGYDIQVAGNPYAKDANDVPAFNIAGNAFNMTLRSVLWQSADDQIINATNAPGADGIPDPFIDSDLDGVPDSGGDLSDNATTPNIGQVSENIILSPTALVVTESNGSLSTTSLSLTSLSAGTYSFAQSWSEVGIMQMGALTTDFMGGGENVTGERINIGRFIPASFSMSVPAITAQCGGFTYAGYQDGVNIGLNKNGQFFDITANITARNAANDTTLNYHGAFAKLQASDITAQAYNVTLSANASGTLNFNPVLTTFNQGVSSFTANDSHYQYSAVSSPFDFRADIQAVDADNVTSGVVNSNIVEVRLGRLLMRDAYGPETGDVEMRLQSEYFNGTNWVLNTADSCTEYVDTYVSFDPASYTDNLSSGETNIFSPTGVPVTLVNGVTSTGNELWFSAPGSGNFGSVIVNFDLATQPWLLFDWDANNLLDVTSSTLNFGYYRGSDRMIFWREIRN
ncbi:DUF6701 domain-containing protein [Aliikangiella sp. IMCC44359]|uniref:DUF6701 domain-containing protein n=1 Tax=Aliikangiella sp. IMCC44359 TaxID=3459125 RepID=UPI00403B1F96